MPSYQIKVHPDALDSLHRLQSEDQQRVERVIEEVASTRSPTDHTKCELLNQKHSAYKIRVGNYRVIFILDKPVFSVLRVGKRQGVYDDIENILANC